MTPHRLKLHHYPASRSARAGWMVHEVVGNNFEVSRVALYDGAIVAFLADAYPAAGLAPTPGP